MGRPETPPTCGPVAGIEMKFALPILQDEGPGEFPILKCQIADVIDEKEKLRWEVPNLSGKVVMRTRFERQADNIGRPTHQLPQLLVRVHLFVGIDRFGQAQHRVALSRCDLRYPLCRSRPVEPEGARTAVELRCIGHAQDGFETEPEPADRVSVPLVPHVGKHEPLDTAFFDGISVVRAVKETFRQADQDALPLRRVQQGVGAVLNEFEQLPMSISAVSRIVFEVGMLDYEARLRAV